MKEAYAKIKGRELSAPAQSELTESEELIEDFLLFFDSLNLLLGQLFLFVFQVIHLLPLSKCATTYIISPKIIEPVYARKNAILGFKIGLEKLVKSLLGSLCLESEKPKAKLVGLFCFFRPNTLMLQTISLAHLKEREK